MEIVSTAFWEKETKEDELITSLTDGILMSAQSWKEAKEGGERSTLAIGRQSGERLVAPRSAHRDVLRFCSREARTEGREQRDEVERVPDPALHV